MQSALIHFVNLLISVIPSTRFFSFKRLLWGLCGANVGNDVKLCLGCRILGSGSVEIGARTWVGIDCTLIVPEGSFVRIGADCDIAGDVLFQCGSHQIGGPERRAGEGFSAPVTVGAGTWIGARVVLLGGADVGTGSVIAAGAVVLSGVYPAHALLAGVPARVVRQLDEAPKVWTR